MPQTSVTLNKPEGMEGQIHLMAPHFNESAVCDEATGIPFGKAVVLKSAANVEVDLPASSGEASAAYGIAIRNPTYPSNDTTVDDGDGVAVCRLGIVTVKVEDAVTKGDAPFIRYAAGGDGLGSFRSDDPGSEAAENTNMEYLDSGSAGDYVRVWIKVVN